mmetsp:Transcript_557/g.1166  ORF Transcript_557/g.1166 Transcript_557/m.1166 type:complete len:280 (-) Transcript_557:318-1157(-)
MCLFHVDILGFIGIVLRPYPNACFHKLVTASNHFKEMKDEVVFSILDALLRLRPDAGGVAPAGSGGAGVVTSGVGGGAREDRIGDQTLKVRRDPDSGKVLGGEEGNVKDNSDTGKSGEIGERSESEDESGSDREAKLEEGEQASVTSTSAKMKEASPQSARKRARNKARNKDGTDVDDGITRQYGADQKYGRFVERGMLLLFLYLSSATILEESRYYVISLLLRLSEEKPHRLGIAVLKMMLKLSNPAREYALHKDLFPLSVEIFAKNILNSSRLPADE